MMGLFIYQVTFELNYHADSVYIVAGSLTDAAHWAETKLPDIMLDRCRGSASFKILAVEHVKQGFETFVT